MRRLLTLIIAAIAIAASAAAQQPFTAVVKAEGTLAEVIGDQIEQIESLVVEGPINAADFATMNKATCYGRLHTIDLSKANIADKAIPDKAFYRIDTGGKVWESHLSSIILPDDIESIGSKAFMDTPLKSIVLPPSLTSIGRLSFADCEELSEINIPDRVTVIPKEAFIGCWSLEHVVLHDKITTIEYDAFEFTGLKEINLPNSLQELGDGALRYTQLSTIVIPESCTTIGMQALEYNEMLESIVVKAAVEIPAVFASECPKLSHVELAEGTRKIKDAAFSDCPSLKTITIPASVEWIGGSAFYNTPLESIYSLASAPRMFKDLHAFNCSKDIPVYIPMGAKHYYLTSPGWWSYFTNFVEIDMAGVDDAIASAGVSISAEGGRIVITADDAPYTVYTTDGRTVATGRAAGTATVDAAPGLYIVRAGATSAKVRL
ncbi:MAG: leucine-rich repeat domain-containing protein [Bacteroides sp.]|nr:leucine-rich repeat domain-containing protein [Bacteroides sp.]